MKTLAHFSDLRAIRKICAANRLNYSYTLSQESPGENVIELIIRYADGTHLDPGMAFNVGRQIELQIALDDSTDKILQGLKPRQELNEKHFSEFEDLP